VACYSTIALISRFPNCYRQEYSNKVHSSPTYYTFASCSKKRTILNFKKARWNEFFRAAKVKEFDN
jgi:hypothetical protein